ncbi:MAG TPA: hypothetical protein PK926_02665 [Spirochaetota bacterium]|nr:hypothetical protein [Spirochaetota bacterium]HPI88018.1 hypothetical protein [Spirochaetota bacterium]HPR46728.1 hypothetical protein [Spirochaetota bacterium]
MIPVKIKGSLLSLLLFMCLASCDDSSGNTSKFSVVNSPTASTSRLDILYGRDFKGEISYIISRTDLDIAYFDDFNASSETKTTASVSADGLKFNDYIPLSYLASSTRYHVYVLSVHDRAVESFAVTTKAPAAGLQETGTITGYNDSSISYTISFPSGYDTASSKTWPFVLSVKAPDFTASDPNFPCITFDTDMRYSSWEQSLYDVEAIKTKVNSIIEDTAYKINRKRIYAYGFSAGGCAVMMIANDDGSDQYNFRAIVANGISGWIGNSEYSGNLGKTDIWLFYGENDTYGTDEAFENMPHTGGDHRLTKIPGVGHDSSPTWASPYTFLWLLSK